MPDSQQPQRLPPLRAWAEVDLDALAQNLEAVTRLVRPAQVMAVVKADGYGHGSVAVARTVEAAGAAALGTATVSEGLALREAGLRIPILVLGPAPGEEEAAVAGDLSLTVVDEEGVRAASAAAKHRGGAARLHVKVETGMTRLGMDPEAVAVTLDRAGGVTHARFEGVFTHLADADGDPHFSREQLSRFRPAADAVRARFPRALRHAAATAGILTLPEAHLDMVRLGLGLYGLVPEPRLAERITLRPAMSLWARVAQVRQVPAGTTVSYGRTFRAERATRIATVAIGYGDGYPRGVSGGRMLIRARSYPVVGRVTMDYTMVDVGGDPVETGDAALVFGPGLGVDEVAGCASTISYEILSRIAPRVDRVYRSGGRVVGLRSLGRAVGVAAPHPAGAATGGERR